MESIAQHVSPDGLLTLNVRRDADDVILQFSDFAWSTSSAFLASKWRTSKDAAVTRFIEEVLGNRAIIAVAHAGSAIRDVWVTDRPAAERSTSGTRKRSSFAFGTAPTGGSKLELSVAKRLKTFKRNPANKVDKDSMSNALGSQLDINPVLSHDSSAPAAKLSTCVATEALIDLSRRHSDRDLLLILTGQMLETRIELGILQATVNTLLIELCHRQPDKLSQSLARMSAQRRQELVTHFRTTSETLHRSPPGEPE